MINFIPVFPLSIVVFPAETLNIHIFEAKYRQMISDCMELKKPFGLITVLDNKVQDHGTLMEIIEVTKTYDTGEMDIKTKGKKVFKTLEHIVQIPDKLYSGAIVSYPKNQVKGKRLMMVKLISLMNVLHDLLKLKNPHKKEASDLWSYDIAHSVGLTLEQEYELLAFTNELHRQEYLRRHFSEVIPVVIEMEALKRKIKLNGHFKNISGFNIS
ncbi:MAG: LON peptidase substrate-binding domain-containing protein [Ginsengibacter sp.]|jgi:hypothetical protein